MPSALAPINPPSPLAAADREYAFSIGRQNAAPPVTPEPAPKVEGEPAKAPEPAPKEKSDEFKANLSKILNRSLKGPDEAKAEEKAVADAAAATKAAEVAAAAAPPKPKAKVTPKKGAVPERGEDGKFVPPVKAAPVAVPEPPDYERIAEAAARGVTEATQRAQPAKPEPAPSAEADLDDGLKLKLEVYKEMAEILPSVYKNLPANFLKGLKAEDDYVAKWQKEHPGEAFDWDAEEHKQPLQAIASIVGEVDEQHFARAAANIPGKALKADLEKQRTEERAQREAQERIQKLVPVVFQKQKETGREFFAEVADPLMEGIITGEPGTLAVNQEKVKEAMSKDPVRSKIYFAEASAAEAVTAAAAGMLNGVVQHNPQDPVHQEVFALVTELERGVLAKPAHERINEGRLFLTNQQMADKEALVKAKKMSASELSNYWTVGLDDVAQYAAIKHAQTAKQNVEKAEKEFELAANARGWTKQNSPPVAKPAAQPAAASATLPRIRPASPTAATDQISNTGIPEKKIMPQNPVARWAARNAAILSGA